MTLSCTPLSPEAGIVISQHFTNVETEAVGVLETF